MAGVAWFALQVGLAPVDPTNVGWLMRNDWAAGYVGWLFFRSAPLAALPLGANPYYPYPIGSTLGFSDSIPIVAVALRPFASVLPQDFQYVGAWLLSAFALQGFVGAKLVKLVTSSAAAQALGGALFALAPPLLHRLETEHASLCAHWIVLTGLWLALTRVDAQIRRRVIASFLLVFAAAGVHPYFVVMSAALGAALVVRLVLVERRGGFALLASGLGGTVLAAASGLALFGFFGSGVRVEANGFGLCSADLSTLLNPMGWSRFIASLPTGPVQFEGFGYLGGGALLLVTAAIVLAVALRTRPSPGSISRVAAAGSVALLLFVFALSNKVTWAGEPIGTIEAYALLPALGSTFRSSGRFVWPLHYLILLGSIALLAAALRSRPRVFVAALTIALVTQAADVSPPGPARLGGEPWEVPGSDAFGLARGSYRHVAMFPPYLVAGDGPAAVQDDGCGPPVWRRDSHLGIAHVAYQLGATFNGAYLARLDPRRAASVCQELFGAIAQGSLDSETVYVVHPLFVDVFLRAHATCGQVDETPLCVSGERSDAFAQTLRANPIR